VTITALPADWHGTLTLPVIAAPMFLASNEDLTVACCGNGVIGTAPALNFRDNAGFMAYLDSVKDRIGRIEAETGRRCAPHGVNLSLRRGNPRLDEDLATTVAHKVPLVITSLGISGDVVDRIHDYGGFVFHDVVNLRFAEKAASAGVDGIVAVAAGAGGHGGALNPFAFLAELRAWFDRTIVLAGSIVNGRQIAAARLLGADMVSIGTRFLVTEESGAPPSHKAMILQAAADDIVYTPHLTGVPASFLRPSLAEWGLDANDLGRAAIDAKTRTVRHGKREGKVWRDVWSAGQGVGTIADIPTAAELCRRLADEYAAASVTLADIAATPKKTL
jgi:nitronate monooxygenase